MRILAGLFCTVLAVAQPAPQPPGDTGKLSKIEGKVVHSVSGAALPRVSVTLMPILTAPGTVGAVGGPLQPAAVAATGADGAFALASVAEGTYTLRFERNGFISTSYGGNGSSTLLRVAKGQDLTGLTVKMLPQSVIAVKVLDENGEPANRAMVQVLRSRFAGGRRQLMPVSSGQTNDLGEFRSTNHGPGSYYVSATPAMTSFGLPPRPAGASADEIPALTYYPGVTDRANASTVTVGVAQEVPVTISLQKGRAYRIRGTAPAGTGPAPMLMLLPRSNDVITSIGPIRPVPVTPDGLFEFTGVAPGAYTINLSRPGGNATGNPGARALVEVVNRDLEGVVLTPVEMVTLTGRVIIEKKDSDINVPSVEGIRIGLTPVDGFSFGAGGGMNVTDAKGTFRAENIPQGRYRIQAIGNLAGAYLKTIRLGQTDVTATGLDLTGLASPPPVELVYSTRTATANVTVTRDSPARAAGSVLLVPETATADPQIASLGFLLLQVNQNGMATRAIPPGKYRVYAVETYDPLEGIDPDVLKRLESKSGRISVNEGETADITVKQLVAADLEVR